MSEANNGKRIRQPIVSVLGHVDHGKTTFLDYIRGTKVAERESGKITQHIGATEVPSYSMKELCGPLAGNTDLSLPGLLFIDTPGHRAFTNLRKRGSSLADMGILVIDVKEGLMEQAKESLLILKQSKVPFVIMANKIDRINGWDYEDSKGEPFIVNVKKQSPKVLQILDEHIYEIMGQVFDETEQHIERYDRIKDFTKTIAVVPGSALYGIGVSDVLMTVAGLAQRYLEEGLYTAVDTNKGRGTILEVKEEKGLGTTLDTIVYDGSIRQGDTLLVAMMDNTINETKIRALLKPKPMDEIRDPRDKFDSMEEVEAAAGIKICAPGLDEVMAGMPIAATDDPECVEGLAKELRSEMGVDIVTDEGGIYIKTDAVGSLEALAVELEQEDIKIIDYGIGNISRRDIVNAATISSPEQRVILGFNVNVMDEAKEEASKGEMAIILNDVIYKLIEDYQEWHDKQLRSKEKETRKEIVHPGMFKVMPEYIFRVKDPAIVGVRVLAGRLRPNQRVLREDGRIIGRIKSIQKDKNEVKEAKAGDEIALAISSAVVGRSLHKNDVLFIDIPEGDAKNLYNELSDQLSVDEKDVLEKVAKIKRNNVPFWGM